MPLPFQRGAYDFSANINFLLPKRLPEQAGVVEYVAQTSFFIEFWTIQIHRALQLPEHFLLGGMSSLRNHQLKRPNIFFIEPLQFADEDVSRMHEAK